MIRYVGRSREDLRFVAVDGGTFIVSVVRDGAPAMAYGNATPWIWIWLQLRSIVVRRATWQVVTLRRRGRWRSPKVISRDKGLDQAEARMRAVEVEAELRQSPPTA